MGIIRGGVEKTLEMPAGREVRGESSEEGRVQRRRLEARRLRAGLVDRWGMETKRVALTQYELEVTGSIATAGHCELIVDGEHFLRVVKYGMARAKVSLDVMTADFKAMLVPTGRKGRGRRGSAESIVAVFRRLAERGVEIRILHAGTPSSAALVELRRELPAGLVIRRCPRLHAKAVIVDARAMYLGSANLTGAGLGRRAARSGILRWGFGRRRRK